MNVRLSDCEDVESAVQGKPRYLVETNSCREFRRRGRPQQPVSNWRYPTGGSVAGVDTGASRVRLGSICCLRGDAKRAQCKETDTGSLHAVSPILSYARVKRLFASMLLSSFRCAVSRPVKDFQPRPSGWPDDVHFDAMHSGIIPSN